MVLNGSIKKQLLYKVSAKKKNYNFSANALFRAVDTDFIWNGLKILSKVLCSLDSCM